nr:hypothetical protein [candidate division Zixibacteria bacterium]
MMLSKFFRALPIFCLFVGVADAATIDTLWIKANLNAERKIIEGSLTWILPDRPDLTSFEFQLFPNVYSSEQTLYLEKNHGLRSHLKETGVWGSMSIDSIMMNGHDISSFLKIEETGGHCVPEPPESIGGERIQIFFRTFLPDVGDRLMNFENDYFLDGWYPRPALLTEDGRWVQPEYGSFAELVGDYYFYDIQFTSPFIQKVAAGVRAVDSTEDNMLMTRHYSFGPIHDFALAISPDFILDSLVHDSITIMIFCRDFERPVLPRIKRAAEVVFDYMSDRVGRYPYDYCSIVLMDRLFAGGVELPGMVVLSSPGGGVLITRLYESLVIHELIHQWFYGVIGSNQIENPWLDESITCLFTRKIMEEQWGVDGNLLNLAGFKVSERDQLRAGSNLLMGSYPLSLSANEFPSPEEYYKMIYSRGPLIVETIENIMGDSLTAVFWKTYFERFRFGHPDTDDFLALVDETAGPDIEKAAGQLIYQPMTIDYSIFGLENRMIDSVNYKIALVLMKKGGLDLPIEYHLFLDNGDTLTESWNPIKETEEFSFIYPSPAIGVVIDPDGIIAIDGNLFNNSLTLKTDNRPGFRMTSGMMFLMESLLSFLGGM